jgi:hypothetical protein
MVAELGRPVHRKKREEFNAEAQGRKDAKRRRGEIAILRLFASTRFFSVARGRPTQEQDEYADGMADQARIARPF